MRHIAEIAAAQGLTADPGAACVVELGLDAVDSATIAPVWAALLAGEAEAQGRVVRAGRVGTVPVSFGSPQRVRMHPADACTPAASSRAGESPRPCDLGVCGAARLPRRALVAGVYRRRLTSSSWYAGSPRHLELLRLLQQLDDLLGDALRARRVLSGHEIAVGDDLGCPGAQGFCV